MRNEDAVETLKTTLLCIIPWLKYGKEAIVSKVLIVE